MSSQPRIIHCTYCIGEGHHINRCKDQSILLLHEEIEEIAAIDKAVGMNSEFLRHNLRRLSPAELKVLGYKLRVPNMSKIPIENIISSLLEIYILNNNL